METREGYWSLPRQALACMAVVSHPIEVRRSRESHKSGMTCVSAASTSNEGCMTSFVQTWGGRARTPMTNVGT